MADMTRIKGRIAETIYPNGTGAITAESHQALLLEMVDDINAKKADKEEVTFVDEKVTILANETESSVQNLQDGLTELSERIDNLPKDDEFDAEGNYPSLRVGTADTAIDLAGRGESVPAEFDFRASGGKSIKDGRAYIKRIKGNSVVWNQLFTMSSNSITNNGMTSTKNADNSITISGTLSQTYATFGKFISNEENHTYLFMLIGGKTLDGKRLSLLNRNVSAAISGGLAFFFHKNTSPDSAQQIGLTGLQVDEVVNDTFFVLQIDLTKMFQAGNEPTTIEEYNARKPIVADEYAYNEGQVIHCNTESIKSVGDNAWDEQWENGSIDRTNGNNVSASSRIRSKNFIPVIPNTDYYLQANAHIYKCYYDSEMNFIKADNSAIMRGSFTTDGNIYFIRFFVVDTTTYNHDICIRLAHSGYKTDYEPYWADILPLPIIRKYFPDGMKSVGTAHDEIRYNKAIGKWEKVVRIGEVDMGTLNYVYTPISESFPLGYFRANLQNKAAGHNMLCFKYDVVAGWTDKGIRGGDSAGVVYIKDGDYTDVASFKDAMQGVMLYYELAEPIVTELDAEDQNFRDYYNVADFGTEEAIPATDAEGNIIPSAAFSADIIYQFNAVDMIREHEIEINELQSIIATMQAQLTSLINGGQ